MKTDSEVGKWFLWWPCHRQIKPGHFPSSCLWSERSAELWCLWERFIMWLSENLYSTWLHTDAPALSSLCTQESFSAAWVWRLTSTCPLANRAFIVMLWEMTAQCRAVIPETETEEKVLSATARDMGYFTHIGIWGYYSYSKRMILHEKRPKIEL